MTVKLPSRVAAPQTPAPQTPAPSPSTSQQTPQQTPRPPDAPATGAESAEVARDQSARRAAHAVIRIALEVVDGLRPPERARGVFTEPIIDMLRVLARGSVPGKHLGAARLHRVHCHRIDVHRDDSIVPYELSATYARGPRLFAIAARLEVKGDRTRCTTIRLI